MKNLIERYVYDVLRRLPERERDEVGKELRSNICDMLPDDAGADDICRVLTELGSPVLLAEQYRQNPRCLISASFYDDYLRALKVVLPIVGIILMIVGLMLRGIDITKDGVTSLSPFFEKVIGSGISSGISGVMQAFVWLTVGFAIADRVSRKSKAAKPWSIKDLPDDIPNTKNTIPLSDSIVELALIAFFSTLGMLICVGRIPMPLILHSEGIQIHQIFRTSFLADCIPVIITAGVMGIGESVVKIIKNRWVPFVCGVTVLSNFVNIGLLLYLCSRQDIFSQDFIALAQARNWVWFSSMSVSGNPLLMVIVAIIIVASLAECMVAIKRTVQVTKKQG